jgi:hypothetical protein
VKNKKTLQYGALSLIVAPVALFSPPGLIFTLFNEKLMQLLVGSKNPVFYDLKKISDIGYVHTKGGNVLFWTLYCLPFLITGLLLGRLQDKREK